MEVIADIKQLEERISVLEKVNIFSETGEDIIKEIAFVLTDINANQGQVIFKKGDEGNAMYIIAQGSVRIHDGNHILSRLGSGQVFGEFSLIDKETRSASVTVEEKTHLLKLDQKDFYKVTSDKVDVTKGVLKKLVKRIREMNILQGKLAKSYLKIQKQKNEIETQHQNITQQKKLLEQTNKELKILNEEKNHLISVVAHGLRNPLTSCTCVTDILKSDSYNFTKDQQEYIRLIHNGLRRINSMINQILDINVIETKRSNIKLQRTNLVSVLNQVKETFKYTLSLKNLELSLNTENLFANIDKNFISLVIDNLISNAIKFSPPDKTISIKLFEFDNKVRIEIKDEGKGIKKEHLKTLFEKHYLPGVQSITKEPYQGTGLNIVKKCVEAMNGKVWCESEWGKGATFIVTFEKN